MCFVNSELLDNVNGHFLKTMQLTWDIPCLGIACRNIFYFVTIANTRLCPDFWRVLPKSGTFRDGGTKKKERKKKEERSDPSPVTEGKEEKLLLEPGTV